MPKLAKRPLLLIVRDGWGQNPDPKWNDANAVYLARKPFDDRLMRDYPNVLIHTSGEDVGLPVGIMGNSEVGHQNIGAGRIVDQEVMRITRRIRDGSFFTNSALSGAINQALRTRGKLHVMGLCSDAGVHSTLEHAYAIAELAKRRNMRREDFCFHAFGDGRDTAPRSGIEFIRQVEAKLNEIGVGRVCSVVGRFYAMDRDNRWERVEKAYRLLTRGDGHVVRSAVEAFSRYYDHPTDGSRNGDEFIEPTVISDDGRTPRAVIGRGDAVIFFNFRGDRPRELIKAFVNQHFPFEAKDKDGSIKLMGFSRGERIEDLYFATMCEYEKGLPVHVIFPKPEKMPNILGGYWSELGLTQFRCAETEKYPHVTFFFNDYREEPFAGEERQIVPSPRDVATYDRKPQMSAYEVTDEMLRRIASEKYDLFVLNYANGDMVGHTGVLSAAIKAVETVDDCVGRVVTAVMNKGGAAIVTADHGNCEQMIDPATGGPHTAHTTYEVPLIVVDDRFRGRPLRTGGRLADIAPTLLSMAGLQKPNEMAGESLLP